MKKPAIPLLIQISCIFAAFTLGFFLGRNINHTPVQLSEVTSATQASRSVQESVEPSEGMGDTTPSTVPETTQSQETGPVNINTATSEELQTLPGIGPVLAQRILDYREEHGDFITVDGLLGVSGIGEKKLEALLGLVTTE